MNLFISGDSMSNSDKINLLLILNNYFEEKSLLDLKLLVFMVKFFQK